MKDEFYLIKGIDIPIKLVYNINILRERVENMKMTDKELFNKIFRALRKKGIVAKQNFLCCQSCGWAELGSQLGDNYEGTIVFYHNQDYDSFEGKELTRKIYLAWHGKAEDIIEEFEKEGFKVEWNGSEHERICILPRKEIV